MRYLYKASDEKFIKAPDVKRSERPSRVSSYTFHLDAVTKGKSEFDKHDIPIVFKCSPDKLLNLCAKVVDGLPLPSVFEWNIEDICKWLREYGYRQYQNTFRENLINGRTLLLLDASALSAMNIKDFDHIKHIAYGIRSLFYFEMTKFGRSLTLYPEFHNELHKLLRVTTGAKYDNVRRSDLWRKLQTLRQKEPNYSHWEVLERWLGCAKDREDPELFGGIHRYKLYRCEAKPTKHSTPYKHLRPCFCLPPCECHWSEKDLRSPWTLKCLPHRQLDKEIVANCNRCIPPCTCHWTSKKYKMGGVLSYLKVVFPKKYGPVHGQLRHPRAEIDTL